MSDKVEVRGEEIQAETIQEAEQTASEVGIKAASSAEETVRAVPETPDEQAELKNRIKELEAKFKELEDENSALKDNYLRKQADFENYRKRMMKEKAETIQFSNKQLLLDLIPILDDFERAVGSGEKSKDFGSFHDGIVLIEKQFFGLLERKWGLRRFDSQGTDFDPQLHEAINTEPRTDHARSVVLEDYQKGYLLHEKVLRAAKVKVSLPAPGEVKDRGTTEPENTAEREALEGNVK